MAHPLSLLRAIAAGEDSYLELKEIVVEGTRLVVAGEGQAAGATFATKNGAGRRDRPGTLSAPCRKRS